MPNCRERNINNNCGEVALSSQQDAIYEPFSVCLPFGKQLVFDGHGFFVKESESYPDGEYGIVVVQNNCIVGVRPSPTFDYTPPPCTPAAAPCGDASTGGGSGITLAPGICNTLAFDSAGRLGSFLQVQAGSGIVVNGCGTVGDPLTIAIDSSGGGGGGGTGGAYIVSGTPNVLGLTGSGDVSNPYILSHITSRLGSGTHGGFTLDAYGHITGYSDETGGFIQSILGVSGISANQTNQVVTVGLNPTMNSGGTVLAGGVQMSYNMYGQLTEVGQYINVPAGIYDPYFYNFYINDSGAIEQILPITRVTGANYSMFFNASTNPTFAFNTTEQGSFRIKYTGNFTAPSAGGPGLVMLMNSYVVRVDDVDLPTYALIVVDTNTDDGTGGNPVYYSSRSLIEIHALATGTYAPGRHTIELTGTVPGICILDVNLIAPRS